MRHLLVAVVCLAFLLALFPGESSAQDESAAQTEMHYGLKGGVEAGRIQS